MSDIKCKDIEERGLLIDMAEGGLDPREAGYVDSHLAECAICLEELEEVRVLLKGLKSAPETTMPTASGGMSDMAEPPLPTPEAFELMERAVKAELRPAKGQVVSIRPKHPKHAGSLFRRYSRTLIPAAAILLLFVGTSVWNDVNKTNHTGELLDMMEVASVPASSPEEDVVVAVAEETTPEDRGARDTSESVSRLLEEPGKVTQKDTAVVRAVAEKKSVEPVSRQESLAKVEAQVEVEGKAEALSMKETGAVGEALKRKPLKKKAVERKRVAAPAPRSHFVDAEESMAMEEAVTGSAAPQVMEAEESLAVGFSAGIDADRGADYKEDSSVGMDYADAVEYSDAIEEEASVKEIPYEYKIFKLMEIDTIVTGDYSSWRPAIEDARRSWLKDDLGLSDSNVQNVISIMENHDAEARPLCTADLSDVDAVYNAPIGTADSTEQMIKIVGEGLQENREALVAIYEARDKAVAAVLSEEEMVRYRELYKILENKYINIMEEPERYKY